MSDSKPLIPATHSFNTVTESAFGAVYFLLKKKNPKGTHSSVERKDE